MLQRIDPMADQASLKRLPLWTSLASCGQAHGKADSGLNSVRIGRPASVRRGVSLQVQILLVLSSHPGGRASVADMNADLALLAGAGSEWFQRIKRMASNAPGLDIFTEEYVIRDADGWQITAAGRKALRFMDKPVHAEAEVAPPLKPEIAIVARGAPAPAPWPSANVISMTERRRIPRRAS